MSADQPYIPFSQREGGEPVPSQLKLGEVSRELRVLLWNVMFSEMRGESDGSAHIYYIGNWALILQDIHVRIYKQMADEFRPYAKQVDPALRAVFEEGTINRLFDLLEYLLRHRLARSSFKQAIANAFVEARAAYRVVGGLITPIASEHDAATLVSAFKAVEGAGLEGARTHLERAVKHLRTGNWADSIRDSIHAVEAVATAIAPGSTTLGAALTELEKNGHLHGSLKKGFGALYGYTSDEAGVRHALALEKEALVDEADALFMLGSCASFVSYLVTNGRKSGRIK